MFQTASIRVQVVKALINKGFLAPMDGHCQQNCQQSDGLKHNPPLSCQKSTETRPRLPNESRPVWCMIQNHAHENKIHPVPARRNLLFPRLSHRPANKSAHPRRNRGVEADLRVGRQSSALHHAGHQPDCRQSNDRLWARMGAKLHSTKHHEFNVRHLKQRHQRRASHRHQSVRFLPAGRAVTEAPGRSPGRLV